MDDATLPLDEELVDDETLPLDDELTLPLDEDDEPPLEVELEVEPPLVEEPPLEVELEPVEVEETTTLPPLDPPPPPKKPPAKKPPPAKPPLPPMIAGTLPELPTSATIGGGGIAAPWLVSVTTSGVQVVRVCVTTRRMRAPCPPASRVVVVRCTTRRTMCAELACAFSATWTAPPPTSAPPHAQAHSFAKAIRTDMLSLSLSRQSAPDAVHVQLGCRYPREVQNKSLSSTPLTSKTAPRRAARLSPGGATWLTSRSGTDRPARGADLGIHRSLICFSLKAKSRPKSAERFACGGRGARL